MGEPVRQLVVDTPPTSPTTHRALLAWVDEVRTLTQPADVVWVDGSEAENRRLTDELVESGTFIRLNPETFHGLPGLLADVRDAAVMLEEGWADACDRIVFVEASRETRLNRLAARRG